MYDRGGFLDAIKSVRSTPRILCQGFQRDLSALFDQELPEEAARRTMAHMHACGECSEFFQAIRLQALAHRDLSVPGSLARRLRRMRGDDLFEGLTDAEILRRMASALYQLGKAYVLLATDDSYLIQVAEEPVVIDSFEGEAKELAAAVQQTGAGQIDAAVLRAHTEDSLAQGRRLLEEALRLKPNFSEALLYHGFVCQLSGESENAQQAYHKVFLRSERMKNRVHAAIQLGLLYDRQHEYARALRMYRWVLASGFVHRKPEFAFVLFNIAVEHLALQDLDAAAAMFARIRRDHPQTWDSAKNWLRESPELLNTVRQHPPCRAEFEASEPAFFAA